MISILRCISSSKDFVCVQQPDGSLTTLTKEEVQSQILGSVEAMAWMDLHELYQKAYYNVSYCKKTGKMKYGRGGWWFLDAVQTGGKR